MPLIPYLDSGERVLYSQFGNVKEGRVSELQAWIRKNEGALAKHAPSGWTYRGTYGTVFGFGRYDVATMWEIGRYGDLDASRAHADPVWDQLGGELQDFFISGFGEATLLREMGDLKIQEPRKPKK